MIAWDSATDRHLLRHIKLYNPKCVGNTDIETCKGDNVEEDNEDKDDVERCDGGRVVRGAAVPGIYWQRKYSLLLNRSPAYRASFLGLFVETSSSRDRAG